MRRNIIVLFILGLLLLVLGIFLVFYLEKAFVIKPSFYPIGVVFFFILSMFFFVLWSNVLGKGGFLSLCDLIPGKEYILIEHIPINGKIAFSIVGHPGSENYISIQSKDLYKLAPKDSFVIVKKQIRKIL